MLKYTRLIMILTVSAFINITTIQTVQADSEFGAPFWNQTTTALEDTTQEETQNQLMATDMDAIAAALQDIQPAAGDEESNENSMNKTGTKSVPAP